MHFQRREYRQFVETQLKVIEQDRMRSEKGIGVEMNLWNTGARYFKLAKQMAEIGDFEQALKFARQGHDAWVQFNKVGEPGSFTGSEGKQYHHYDEMRQAYGAVAERFYRGGRLADSAEFARHYIDACREWAADKPDYDFALLSVPQAYLRPPYHEFGTPQEALRLIDAALAAHEKKPMGSGIPEEVWRLRGKAHFRLGNWEKSIAAMQRSIEIRSDNNGPNE